MPRHEPGRTKTESIIGMTVWSAVFDDASKPSHGSPWHPPERQHIRLYFDKVVSKWVL